MKLSKIELQSKDGDYVLCTLWIDVSYDIDQYVFNLEAVTVAGVRHPELFEIGEEWVTNHRNHLVREAREEAYQQRIAWEESQ